MAFNWLISIVNTIRSPKGRRTGKKKILSRSEHNVSRKQIPEYVLKVLYRLTKHGYEAYLVGGGVRDLLLGRTPKDFDIATDATPEEVRALFRNCRLIGRRFRLAHVYFREHTVEVATFRSSEKNTDIHAHSEDGMILRDNVYGSLEDDALRRDFTINSLYYSVKDFSVTDLTGGVPDISKRLLRMIGDPETRYREDPVRMLRAIRFKAILGLTMEEMTQRPIPGLAHLLQNVSPARLFDEVLKLFHSGYAQDIYEELLDLECFSTLFPYTDQALGWPDCHTDKLLSKLFESTDLRVKNAQWVTPAFLFAGLLWYPFLKKSKAYEQQGIKPFPAAIQASQEVLKEQSAYTIIPARIAQSIREIWISQMRLEDRLRSKIVKINAEPKFRAAYDFLLLRASVGEPVEEIAQWWTDYIAASPDQQQNLIHKLPSKTGGHRRKRYHKRSPSGKPKGE